ncbi:MAG: ATP-binding protein, partial [Bdellovibrionales bacterium]|nr:ATP-binding protein [Bdellovibrionales bacterium]
MTGLIRILENSVIDQIAAGEVVDRPAHMIKELCENSLDAGATELVIDFQKGGRHVLIRDNGRGISPEDLPLTVARHATSKIKNADDLWEISSYGFRGEALASIGAVSCLQITSRTVDQALGSQLICRFGELGQVTQVGAEVGTVVQVSDLFENVPARLKFLKTDAGESSAIKTQLKAL